MDDTNCNNYLTNIMIKKLTHRRKKGTWINTEAKKCMEELQDLWNRSNFHKRP